ncbi:MAG: hypothetical protein QOK29_1726, partial [Rhodospirillaceae bacterium]|nr:hypothetical protein [Rhodospirillaceae bacterium]
MRKQILAILIAGTVISPSAYSAIPGSSDGRPWVPAAVILADDVPQNSTVPASDKSKAKANGSTEVPTTPPTSPVTEATGEG